MTAGLSRYVRTIRHLRPVQIYGRLQHHVARPRIERKPAPRLQLPTGLWAKPIERAGVLSGPTSIRLLNSDGEIARAEHWNDPARDKLWLYNLHYFDDLRAAPDDARLNWQKRLVARWIAENPVGEGNGWEPYPLSLRIVNWLKWALGGVEPERQWVESLAGQAHYLDQRIEWHLLGNHLLANAKALIFAGACFTGHDAQGWLQTGLGIYQRELKEQILEDGGHFERSPMYHAIILEDLLDVANLLRAQGLERQPVAAELGPVIEKMLKWLDVMVHPDGGIGFFNDAAFGIAAPANAIRTYAGRLEVGGGVTPAGRLVHLPASGYVRMERRRACAILDAAPVGPNHLPGHAHADTLSFELSLVGQRVIVNGGTSVYGDCEQRQLERATAAHSTVEIDGENSSEVWRSFRVGRRARILDVEAGESDAELSVSAAHDGYRHLAGNPVHRRTWTMTDKGLTVVDQIDGTCREAVARFHLGDGVTAFAAGRQGHLELPDGARVRWVASAPGRIRASQWHREFGVTVPTAVLEFAMTESSLTVQFDWM